MLSVVVWRGLTQFVEAHAVECRGRGVDARVEIDCVGGSEGVGPGGDASAVGEVDGAEGLALECRCFAINICVGKGKMWWGGGVYQSSGRCDGASLL